MLTDVSQFSSGLWVALAILAVIQIVLMVIALISIARRPADGINGGKFVWVLIVVLFNTIGPILYFAIGRRRATATAAEPQGFAAPDHASVADELYGQRSDPS